MKVGDRVRLSCHVDDDYVNYATVPVGSTGAIVQYEGEGDPASLVIFDHMTQPYWVRASSLCVIMPVPDLRDPVAVARWLSSDEAAAP